MYPQKASPCAAHSPESLVKPHYYILLYTSHSWGYSPSVTVSPRRDRGGDVWAVSSGLCQGPRLTSPGISLDRNTSGNGGPKGSKSAHVEEQQRRHVLKRTSLMPQVHMRLGAHHCHPLNNRAPAAHRAQEKDTGRDSCQVLSTSGSNC